MKATKSTNNTVSSEEETLAFCRRQNATARIYAASHDICPICLEQSTHMYYIIDCGHLFACNKCIELSLKHQNDNIEPSRNLKIYDF